MMSSSPDAPQTAWGTPLVGRPSSAATGMLTSLTTGTSTVRPLSGGTSPTAGAFAAHRTPRSAHGLSEHQKLVSTYLPGGAGSAAVLMSHSAPVTGVSPSASLPVLVKADLVQLGLGGPRQQPKKRTMDEDMNVLRRRNRELEQELKKMHAKLSSIKVKQAAKLKEELDRQVVVWNLAKDKWMKEHTEELARVRKECEGSLASTRAQHDKALAKTLWEQGASAEEKHEALKREMEARAEAQAAKEKEERVELLRRQIGRRMMNSSLTRGWSAWYDLWTAKSYALRRLREVANRLRKPEV